MVHNVDAMTNDIRALLTYVQTEKPKVWKLALDTCWTWYPNTTQTAIDCAEMYNISVVQAAGIIAAFSIRTRWHKNLEDVMTFMDTGECAGLKLRVKKARAILALGVNATWEDVAKVLNGKKVVRFAHNILHGNSSIMATIDVWMCRVMHIAHKKLSKIVGLYEAAEQAVMIVASELMMPVPVAQAFIWVCVRGRAD